MKLSRGIKSALLDDQLRNGTSKTKKSHAWLVEIAWFWEAFAYLLPSGVADFIPCDSIMQRAH